VRDFGGKSLNGRLYCNLGTLTGAPPTSEEKKTIVEVLGKLNPYAKEAGVRLGIEPVNCYETYLYNTGADAAELIRSVGGDDMIIQFDTLPHEHRRRELQQGAQRGWSASCVHSYFRKPSGFA
jgi:D-psicose/D-tagatose/L-ribulose 3-epimerase